MAAGESDSNEVLEALQKEASETRERITQLHDSGHKAVTIGIGVFSVSLPLALREATREIAYAVPFLISIVSLYTLANYIEVRALGGYRRFLEEQINRILGSSVLSWDGRVAPKVHQNSWAVRAYWSTLVLTLVLSWTGAVALAAFQFGVWVSTVVIALFLLTCTLLGLSLRQLASAPEAAYREACAAAAEDK